MAETKRKNKCIKLLGSIVLGLTFLCLGFFAGFGGKIEEFVKGADEPTTGGTTNNYENAMIYVDSGATTNITGGSVGAMSNGNSVYVADGGTLNVTGGTVSGNIYNGGTLNVTGGTVSGNIYNGGTLNYTAGTITSVTLAEGKYITLQESLENKVDITLENPQIGATIAYIGKGEPIAVNLDNFNVLNLPENGQIELVDNWSIKVTSKVYEVGVVSSQEEYGTVDIEKFEVVSGEDITISGNTLSYGETTVTATPATQTAQYTYSFAGWYVGDTQITDSYTVTGDTTITANFTRSTRTYTVTISRNNTSYGTVSRSSVTNVPYGATIRRGSSSNQLIVNTTTVTATPASSTSSYTYSFSSWRLSSSSGTTITTTGITLTGDTTIYAVFSRASVPNYYANIAPFYGPSTITSCKQGTEGTVGGTVSFVSYPYQHTITEMGIGRYLLFSNTRGTANIRATAKAGYTFAGWYDRNTDTTPLTTSATYTIAVTTTDSTGAVNTYFALFKATTSTIIANMFNPYDVSSINHQAKGNNFEEAETVALNNTELFSLNLFEPFILSSADQIIIKRNKQID